MTDVINTGTDEGGGKYEQLRYLTDQYIAVQKLRIANMNRDFAATEGLDTNPPDDFLLEIVDDLLGIEKKLFGQMKRVVKHHPAWPWAGSVKGIGPTLSTKVLGLIGDIEKFPTISKLWRFSGYAVIDGKIDRPVKGQKLVYNRTLKTALYNCGDSFVKSRSPYRDIYDQAKAKYRQKRQVRPMLQHCRDELYQILDEFEIPADHPELLRETEDGKKEWDKLIKLTNRAAGAEKDHACWSDGHVDNAGRRKMVKLFLSHLWMVWREAEGLPTSDPFVIASPDHPEHTHYIDPWAFTE